MGRDRIRASKKRGKHVRRFGWDEGRPRIGRGAGGARAARRGWRGGCGTCESVRLLRLVGPFLGPERARCGCWQCGWPRWRDCQPALHSCGPGQCIQTPPAIVPFSSESFFAAPNGCPKTSATRSAFVNAYYAATPAHVCSAPRTAGDVASNRRDEAGEHVGHDGDAGSYSTWRGSGRVAGRRSGLEFLYRMGGRKLGRRRRLQADANERRGDPLAGTAAAAAACRTYANASTRLAGGSDGDARGFGCAARRNAIC